MSKLDVGRESSPLAEGNAAEVDDPFDTLLQHVGSSGPFQRAFRLRFNVFFTAVSAMSYLNIVLALTVPEHWCRVPGKPEHLDDHQWRALTVPKQGETFQSCMMYNLSSALGDYNSSASHGSPNSTSNCQHGWEYDRMWFSETAPSQENWVCDRALLVSNTFAFSRLADVVGSFVFGQLADVIGRRPVFVLALTFMLVGRCLSVFVSSNYTLFLVAVMAGSVSTTSSFQGPLSIGLEISAKERRAFLAMLQTGSWTLGLCVVPLVAWVARDWFIFMLITSAPLAIFFLMLGSFTESPRWLANKGHSKRSLAVLQKIAKTNGTSLPSGALAILEKLASRKEKVYGIPSLFSSWRLAKNTSIVCTCWVVNTLLYYTLVINAGTLSGNPFLNYLWQAAAELPGTFLGRFLTDRWGRRWTETIFFLLQAVGGVIMIFVVPHATLGWVAILMMVVLKLLVTVTFYTVYLQAMETFPTCARQTGSGFASLVSSAVGILGPYVVYLGTSVDGRLPYGIMAALAVLGMIAAPFLPETLNQKLPESLEDAQIFGADQDFWSWPKKTINDRDLVT